MDPTDSIVFVETCKCEREEIEGEPQSECQRCKCPIVAGHASGQRSEFEPRNPPSGSDTNTQITVGPSGDTQHYSDTPHSSFDVLTASASLQSDIQSVDPPVPMVNPDNTPRFPEQSQNTVPHHDGHQPMETETPADTSTAEIGNNSIQSQFAFSAGQAPSRGPGPPPGLTRPPEHAATGHSNMATLSAAPMPNAGFARGTDMLPPTPMNPAQNAQGPLYSLNTSQSLTASTHAQMALFQEQTTLQQQLQTIMLYMMQGQATPEHLNLYPQINMRLMQIQQQIMQYAMQSMSNRMSDSTMGSSISAGVQGTGQPNFGMTSFTAPPGAIFGQPQAYSAPAEAPFGQPQAVSLSSGFPVDQPVSNQTIGVQQASSQLPAQMQLDANSPKETPSQLNPKDQITGAPSEHRLSPRTLTSDDTSLQNQANVDPPLPFDQSSVIPPLDASSSTQLATAKAVGESPDRVIDLPTLVQDISLDHITGGRALSSSTVDQITEGQALNSSTVDQITGEQALSSSTVTPRSAPFAQTQLSSPSYQSSGFQPARQPTMTSPNGSQQSYPDDQKSHGNAVTDPGIGEPKGNCPIDDPMLVSAQAGADGQLTEGVRRIDLETAKLNSDGKRRSISARSDDYQDPDSPSRAKLPRLTAGEGRHGHEFAADTDEGPSTGIRDEQRMFGSATNSQHGIRAYDSEYPEMNAEKDVADYLFEETSRLSFAVASLCHDQRSEVPKEAHEAVKALQTLMPEKQALEEKRQDLQRSGANVQKVEALEKRILLMEERLRGFYTEFYPALYRTYREHDHQNISRFRPPAGFYIHEPREITFHESRETTFPAYPSEEGAAADPPFSGPSAVPRPSDLAQRDIDQLPEFNVETEETDYLFSETKRLIKYVNNLYVQYKMEIPPILIEVKKMYQALKPVLKNLQQELETLEQTDGPEKDDESINRIRSNLDAEMRVMYTKVYPDFYNLYRKFNPQNTEQFRPPPGYYNSAAAEDCTLSVKTGEADRLLSKTERLIASVTSLCEKHQRETPQVLEEAKNIHQTLIPVIKNLQQELQTLEQTDGAERDVEWINNRRWTIEERMTKFYTEFYPELYTVYQELDPQNSAQFRPPPGHYSSAAAKSSTSSVGEPQFDGQLNPLDRSSHQLPELTMNEDPARLFLLTKELLHHHLNANYSSASIPDDFRHALEEVEAVERSQVTSNVASNAETGAEKTSNAEDGGDKTSNVETTAGETFNVETTADETSNMETGVDETPSNDIMSNQHLVFSKYYKMIYDACLDSNMDITSFFPPPPGYYSEINRTLSAGGVDTGQVVHDDGSPDEINEKNESASDLYEETRRLIRCLATQSVPEDDGKKIRTAVNVMKQKKSFCKIKLKEIDDILEVKGRGGNIDESKIAQLEQEKESAEQIFFKTYYRPMFDIYIRHNPENSELFRPPPGYRRRLNRGPADEHGDNVTTPGPEPGQHEDMEEDPADLPPIDKDREQSSLLFDETQRLIEHLKHQNIPANQRKAFNNAAEMLEKKKKRRVGFEEEVENLQRSGEDKSEALKQEVERLAKLDRAMFDKNYSKMYSIYINLDPSNPLRFRSPAMDRPGDFTAGATTYSGKFEETCRLVESLVSYDKMKLSEKHLTIINKASREMEKRVQLRADLTGQISKKSGKEKLNKKQELEGLEKNFYRNQYSKLLAIYREIEPNNRGTFNNEALDATMKPTQNTREKPSASKVQQDRQAPTTQVSSNEKTYVTFKVLPASQFGHVSAGFIAYYPHWDRAPLRLTQGENGILEVRVPRGDLYNGIPYKYYFKYSKEPVGGSEFLEYEWLDGLNNYSYSITNRHLERTDIEHGVVYDGIALPKQNMFHAEKQSLLSRAGNLIRSLVSEQPSSEWRKSEKMEGMAAMLPVISSELFETKTASQIISMIERIEQRQKVVFQEFKQYPRTTDVQQVMEKFVIEIRTFHDRYTAESEKPVSARVLINSTLVRLHFTSLGDYWKRYVPDEVQRMVKAAVLHMNQSLATTIDHKPLTLQEILSWTGGEFLRYLPAIIGKLEKLDKVADCWIGLVPVIHGVYWEKLESNRKDKRDKDPIWWGHLPVMSRLVEKSRILSKDKWRDWWVRLSPFFKMDPFVARTFLAALSKEALDDILVGGISEVVELPVDALLACFEYFSPREIPETAWMNLTLWLSERLVCLSAEENTDAQQQMFMLVLAETKQLIYKFWNNYELKDNAVFCIKLQLLVMHHWKSTECDAGALRKIENEFVLITLKRCLADRRTSHYTSTKQIMEWEKLFLCADNLTSVRSWWTENCAEQFQALLKEAGGERIMDCYLDTTVSSAEMDALLLEHAITHAQILVQTDRYALRSRGGKVAKLINHSIEKTWKSVEGMTDQLEICLEVLKWKNFVHIYNFAAGENEQLLNKRCRQMLTKTVDAILNILTQLKARAITVGDFHKLVAHAEGLAALCQCREPRLQTEQANVIEYFKAIRQHLDEYDSFKRRMSKLFQAGKVALEITLRDRVENWFDQPIHTIEVRSLFDNRDQVHSPYLDAAFRTAAEKYENMQTRKLYTFLFRKRVKELQGDSLNDVTQAVHSALDEHSDYVARFISGELTTQQLVNLKEKVFAGHLRDLLNEVKIDLGEHFRRTELQIEICDNLRTYRKGAQAVLELRATFKVADKFEEMRKLAESGDESLQLQNVTEDIQSSASRLKNITENQIECLKQFNASYKFVEWARKEVPMREIKVFVELATQTLGEDDHGVQRVDHLMNALNGYSAMIYNLDPATADFKAFMEICKSVWKELDATPGLQQDLKLAARELETWQELKSNLDGMEIATISQADSINKTGRFVVGCTASTQQNLKLNDVIKLTCELEKLSKEGRKQKKKIKTRYSAEREQSDPDIKGSLEELQEKLTLIAGDKQRENKDTIDRFDRTRDNVMKLGQAYIELHHDGCILFDDLEIFINNRDRCLVQMLFKGMEQPIQIIQKSPDETPIDHIDRLHRFMVDCVKSWRDSLENYRKSNPILNHFTTAQLVLLRKDLGRLISSASREECSEALSLLELIRKTSEKEVLTLGLDYNKPEQTEDQPEDEEMDGPREGVVDDLEDRGHSRESVVQAVKTLGHGRPYTDYITWIVENEDHLMEMDTENIAANLLGKVENDSDCISILERVWKEFLEKTCTSSTQFLSLEHLAWILEKLKEKLIGRLQRQRRTPEWIERGKPNLITCKQDEMYKLMLALYMADLNAENPTRSQILLCTSTTTVEEVEIFMNRAITDDHSLYTMVNTQRLSNAHCRRIEDIIYSSKDHRAKNYVIAFLCDQNSSEARIRSYLSKYQVKFFDCPKVEDCEQYVKQLLMDTSTRTISARSIDPERLSCRVIRSNLAGVGKSLTCQRMREKFVGNANEVVIPIYKTVNIDAIMEMLTKRSTTDPNVCNIIHFDVSFEVQDGVDDLLTNLVILKSLCNSRGRVWHLRPQDYYMIECMPYKKNGACVHQILDLLPTTWCQPPAGYGGRDHGDAPDPQLLMSAEWQRVLKFLYCHKQKKYRYDIREINPIRDEAVQLLTEFCGLQRPSWSELTHFVKFLSFQLEKVDSSPFCSLAMLDQGYSPQGFREFVVRFMVVMAQDFATRSLAISEESPGLSVHDLQQRDNECLMEMLSVKRKWESSNHPYLFFNEDGATFSFIGFVIQDDVSKSECEIIDSETREPLPTRLPFPRTLKNTLERRPYDMNLCTSFSALSKHHKLAKMQEIMVRNPHLYHAEGAGITDPDTNYELTLDNVKKILAIHQRIRVGIPVIIMGDTGCGKTKLIDYASKLQVPDQLRKNGPNDKDPNKVTNMITVKVHGGTTEQHIRDKVIDAQKIARDNLEKCRDYAMLRGWPEKEAPNVYTILFLDEANTTEAIGLVKEILCDGRILGVPIEEDSGLKIVAACNPYRKHKEGMIRKLRQAGLGYFVDEQQTTDRFGHIPMRHLVYRVQALSQSLLPLVWDFGTLTANVEKQYISQMLTSSNKERMKFGSLTRMVSELICETHQFMRLQDDECSFVSLRDVNRLIEITAWFHKISDTLFPMMRDAEDHESDYDLDESEEDEENQPQQAEGIPTLKVAQSLLLALGVCYLARLEPETRERYAEHISRFIEQMFPHVGNGGEYFIDQIELCQDVIIEEIIKEVKGKHKNIAKNKALKENAFMMLVCIEQRIPLFLVGKPGSSKSLSKAMVIDAMDGRKSDSLLLQRMKQTYMVSFQCSRLATPNSIVSVFKEGALKQKSRKDKLEEFVSIVVLDEVGLAEDSANMPLKALHPLLEDGCEGHEEPAEWKRCAFIGISNWALDPAKMNRGIFVQRGTPANDELITIAEGIRDSATGEVKTQVDTVLISLVNGYKAICKVLKPSERDLTEFFGLRDFYSLVKMVLSFAKESCDAGEGRLYRSQLEHAIRRNFGGFDSSQIDCLQEFKQKFTDWDGLPDVGEDSRISRPPTQAVNLIQSSLQNSVPALQEMENRYLLVLTENLSILGMILEKFQQDGATQRPEIIFGSYFRRDIRFTQVCHNINLIKNCMAVGKPVILLNLDDLYESLYDTLNQYFSTLGSTRFVGLGLGTHRVKARIDNNFRLVVIADSKKVYKEFPIPLINRLEKHFISINTLLSEDQRNMKKELENWAHRFVRPTARGRNQQCPANCHCGQPLNLPIPLPCSHYLGRCCEQNIFRQKMPRVCPYHGCGQREIPEGFEFIVDDTALKLRDMFEGSMDRPGAAFIGYSSEMVALAVMQASAGQSCDEKEILKDAKQTLLEVCTADSVLRLKHTDLQHEQDWVKDVYFEEQRHEMLPEYMQNLIRRRGDKHLFVQVTTFAKLLNQEEVQDLNEQFHEPGQNVFNMTVNDFDTEAEFVDKVRNAYQGNKEGERSILLLQCESSHDYPELLDSVRHILLRESETAGTQAEHVITVLLLNMPRGVPFVGYQGTPWHCVHIDDPSCTQRTMPLISECLKLQPSEVLGQVIRNTKMDRMDEMDSSTYLPRPTERMETDEEPGRYRDSDDMEEDEQSFAPVSESLASARNTIRNSHMDDSEAFERLDDPNQLRNRSINIENIIIPCLPQAMSLVERHGKEGLVELREVMRDSNLHDVHVTLLERAKYLLSKSEEKQQFTRYNWVSSNAAKASNMKKSETLRSSLELCMYREISPGLAAVIALCEPYMNLSLLQHHDPWKRKLWKDLFVACCEDRLQYERIATEAGSLPDTYKLFAPSAGDQEFRSRLPFSWIIKHIIDTMLSSPATQGSAERHIDETSVGRVLSTYNHHLNEVLDDYVQDFVHLSHPSHNNREHELVGKTIVSEMKHQMTSEGDQIPQTICGMMVLIHRVFEKTSVSFKKLSSVVNVVNTCKEVLDNYMDKVTLGVPCYLLAIGAALSREDSVAYTKLAPNDEAARNWILRVEGLLGLLQDHVRDQSASEIYDDGERDNATASLEKECHQLRTNLMLKKLYIQHVVLPMPTPTEGKDANIKPLENLSQLSKICKTKRYADYGGTRAYMDIVELLTESLLRHVKKAFGLKNMICPVAQCKEKMVIPSKLSCGHLVCPKCALTEGLYCPECKQLNTSHQKELLISKDDSSLNQQYVESLSQYRHYLNLFFMEFVSQIVFRRLDGSDCEPEPNVIRHLVNCVTFQSGTRPFSMFNSSDVIDPTPVVRSFLLKLLLKASLNRERDMAADFSAEKLLLGFVNEATDSSADLRAQTMALLVDCLKDDMDISWKEDEIAGRFEDCGDCFDRKVQQLSLQDLKSVAEAHYLIKTVASRLIEGEPCDEEVVENFENFLDECYDFRDTDKQVTEQPRMYIARMVLEEFGEGKLMDISAPENLQFMLPRPVLEALHTFSVPDMLKLGSSRNYGQVLTDITDLLQPSQSPEQLDNKLNNFITNHANVPNQNDLLKALFTRITRYTNTEVPPNQNTVNDLLAKLRNSRISATSKIWMEKLLSNRLDAVFNLSNSEGTNLAMMALHMYTCTENKRGLVYPFVQLITSPQTCQQLYLPTMPDNPVEEIKDVVIGAINQQGDSTRAYKCPNGHVYYIGNCGRPYYVGRCPECGSEIGGQSHREAVGNQALNDYNEYATRPGYLREVTETNARPERSLNVQSCAILRCLVHLSLLASAVHQPHQVGILLGAPGDVMAYLATRIRTGIQQIATTSNLSRESCIILLHLVMGKIGQAPNAANASLANKELRKQWEQEFNRDFIADIFNKDSPRKITVCQMQLQGTNQDLGALCEPKPEVDESNKLNTSYLWIYNRPLNLNIIDQEIPEDQGQRLKQFIQHLPSLEAMGNLPVVIKLVREMAETFHCKITKHKAENWSVASFLRDEGQDDHELSERLKHLVEVFMNTWRMVIPSMEESDRFPLSINDALMSILPVSQANNEGRPSALHKLINHLVTVNNSFLKDTVSGTEIPVQSVGQSGLITVPEGSDELMSLVLRHSQYEFGQRMERSRDWAKVDDELLQRYLVGKRCVSPTSVDQLPVYQFPHEFTLVKLLTQISPKQTLLSKVQREALIRDSGRYGINELNRLLTNLATMLQICCNISVFNQEEPIIEAFKRNFGKESLLLQKVPGLCLSHVSETWVLLRFQQAKALLRNEQQPFEEIDQKCLDPLDKRFGSHLKEYLVSYNSMQTHSLLNDLCEFIILKLNNVTAAKHEPEFFNQSLNDHLYFYLEKKYEDDENVYTLAERLRLQDPELTIPISQAVETWKYIYLIYSTPVDYES